MDAQNGASHADGDHCGGRDGGLSWEAIVQQACRILTEPGRIRENRDPVFARIGKSFAVFVQYGSRHVSATTVAARKFTGEMHVHDSMGTGMVMGHDAGGKGQLQDKDDGSRDTGHREAFLGGGCFWCLEAVYQNVRGVREVVSGYMGGWVADPSYEQVCGKATGHAEVVRIVFDPQVIGYAELLGIFFSIHDPTTPDRQGNDVGPQYRSIIFAADAEQFRLARQALAQLTGAAAAPDDPYDAALVLAMAGLRMARPPVTQIVDLSATAGAPGRAVEQTFWPAEAEHQNYYRLHPSQGYCAFVVAPKVDKARQRFTDLMRDMTGG